MCILQLFNVVENLPLIHVVRVWQHPLEVLARLLLPPLSSSDNV